jgi:hypothetical protein
MFFSKKYSEMSKLAKNEILDYLDSQNFGGNIDLSSLKDSVVKLHCASTKAAIVDYWKLNCYLKDYINDLKDESFSAANKRLEYVNKQISAMTERYKESSRLILPIVNAYNRQLQKLYKKQNKKHKISANCEGNLPVGELYTDEDLVDIEFAHYNDFLIGYEKKGQELHDKMIEEPNNNKLQNDFLLNEMDKENIKKKIELCKNESLRIRAIRIMQEQTQDYKNKIRNRAVSDKDSDILVAAFKRTKEAVEEDGKKTEGLVNVVMNSDATQIKNNLATSSVNDAESNSNNQSSATAKTKSDATNSIFNDPRFTKYGTADEYKQKQILDHIDEYIDKLNISIYDCQYSIEADTKSSKKMYDIVKGLLVKLDNVDNSERDAVEGQIDDYDGRYKSIMQNIKLTRNLKSQLIVYRDSLEGVRGTKDITERQKVLGGIDLSSLKSLVTNSIEIKKKANETLKELNIVREVEDSVKIDTNSTFNAENYIDDKASANDDKYAKLKEAYK